VREQRSRGDPDAGVATVLACVCVAILLVVTVAVVQVAGAVVAARRASAAADLGALAGAAVVLQGNEVACARAARVIAANRAIMSGCEVLGFDVRVQVQVTVRIGPLDAVAHGRARAGPDR